MDDVSDIGTFYNNQLQKEHNRLQHHQLEFDLTLRYFNQYLPAQGHILEIGAATGHYTLELAQRGYTVTAIDLSPVLLDENRRQIARAGVEKPVDYKVADARDLSAITGTTFDAVLLMGPLYHLIAESDRKLALKQVYDRLKPGGILFSALLSRYGILGDLIKNNPAWIENQAEVKSFFAHGKRPDDFPRGGFRAYFATVSEISVLHEALGFETLSVAGIEPAISADDESYNKLAGQQRQYWLDLFYALSTEQSIIGASRHLLYIGRKNEKAA